MISVNEFAVKDGSLHAFSLGGVLSSKCATVGSTLTDLAKARVFTRLGSKGVVLCGAHDVVCATNN